MAYDVEQEALDGQAQALGGAVKVALLQSAGYLNTLRFAADCLEVGDAVRLKAALSPYRTAGDQVLDEPEGALERSRPSRGAQVSGA